jgi:hypothetical protein
MPLSGSPGNMALATSINLARSLSGNAATALPFGVKGGTWECQNSSKLRYGNEASIERVATSSNPAGSNNDLSASILGSSGPGTFATSTPIWRKPRVDGYAARITRRESDNLTSSSVDLL